MTLNEMLQDYDELVTVKNEISKIGRQHAALGLDKVVLAIDEALRKLERNIGVKAVSALPRHQ